MLKSFHLTLPSDKTKVLAVTIYGKLNYKLLGHDNDSDDVWTLIPVKNKDESGFYLVSSSFKMVLDYNPSISGEEVTAVGYTGLGDHTVWYISDDSEIYTYIDVEESPGVIVLGKKYLWSILDGVYVTADEHLAEKWTAVSLDHYDRGKDLSDLVREPKTEFSVGLKMVCIIIIVCLAYYFLGRKIKWS